MPPDTTIELISRTIGHDQIVDEMIFTCTHTVAMDWYLPGVAPTGRRIEAPTVAIVKFRDGRIESEHIYWDQASVLVQIGLLDPGSLPVAGSEVAEKLRDPEPALERPHRAGGRPQPGVNVKAGTRGPGDRSPLRPGCRRSRLRSRPRSGACGGCRCARLRRRA